MEPESKHSEKSLRPDIAVRRYSSGEAAILQTIYSKSTRELNSKDYTPEQIERWVAKHTDSEEWANRLKKTNPFVAILDESPVAFGELEANGHIDFFYCHPDWQGCGAGSQLMKAIETEAKRMGLKTLFAEVSVTAEPFWPA